MRALILAGLVLAVPCCAQPAAVVSWMTGARLLKKLEPVSPQDVPWTPKSAVSREELAALHTNTNIEFARGYVAALHDATVGKTWCFDAQHQTPNDEDFWDTSRWRLAGLPVDQRQRNAAELLPEIWRAKWPCPSSSRRKQ
jgi:hypothetical protein